MLIRRDFKPGDERLKPYIEKFIVLTGNRETAGGCEKVRILPGTGPALYINFACRFSKTGEWMRCGISGIHERFYFLEHSSGDAIDEIVVLFSPCGLSAFTGINMNDLTNNLVDSGNIFGAGGDHLYEMLGNASSGKRLGIVEDFFIKYIRDINDEDRFIHEIAGGIVGDRILPSSLHIERLSNLSFRQAERRFRKRTGVSMRCFNKIARFEKAVMSVYLPGNKSTLTDTAYDLDYFDQSHFIREFRELSGLTPGDFKSMVK